MKTRILSAFSRKAKLISKSDISLEELKHKWSKAKPLKVFVDKEKLLKVSTKKAPINIKATCLSDIVDLTELMNNGDLSFEEIKKIKRKIDGIKKKLNK
jgi:hypothetical protein